MEKVIRNNKVAVLYSSGFGAGWYSWNTENPILLFHPKLVVMVESNRQKEINEDWVKTELGIDGVYCGGASDLSIQWLEVGTHFDIEEYDGAESIKTFDDIKLIA